MMPLARRGLLAELACVIDTDTQAMLQRYRTRRAAALGSSVGGATGRRRESAALSVLERDRLGQENPQ